MVEFVDENGVTRLVKKKVGAKKTVKKMV